MSVLHWSYEVGPHAGSTVIEVLTDRHGAFEIDLKIEYAFELELKTHYRQGFDHVHSHTV